MFWLLVQAVHAGPVLLIDKDCPTSGCIDEHAAPGTYTSRSPTLRVIDLQGPTRATVRHVWSVRYGQVEGDKTFENDRKTPHGSYSISKARPRDIGGPFGGWSLPIDYPNAEDERDAGARDPGDDITFHGGPGRATDGCVRVFDLGQDPADHHTESIETLAGLVRRAQEPLQVLIVPWLDPKCRVDAYGVMPMACSVALDRLVSRARAHDRPAAAQVVAQLADVSAPQEPILAFLDHEPVSIPSWQQERPRPQELPPFRFDNGGEPAALPRWQALP